MTVSNEYGLSSFNNTIDLDTETKSLNTLPDEQLTSLCESDKQLNAMKLTIDKKKYE